MINHVNSANQTFEVFNDLLLIVIIGWMEHPLQGSQRTIFKYCVQNLAKTLFDFYFVK